MERDVSVDVNEQLARLTTSVEAGFAGLRAEVVAVNRRLDDHRDTSDRMHGENSRRLDLINGKVGKAHDRVAIVEVITTEMKDTLVRVRKRGHDIANELHALMNRVMLIEKVGGHRVFSGAPDAASADHDLLSKAPSLATLIKLGSIVVGAVYGTYFVMAAMGFHR